MKRVVLLLSLLVALLVSCGPAATPTPAPTATPRVIVVTPTPGPTPTAAPTPTERVVVVTPTPVPAPKAEVPQILVMTSWPVGTTGQALSMGVAEAVAKGSDKKMRLVPSGTDVGRMVPLLDGRAHMTLVSSATAWNASVGAYEFSDPTLGPVPLQMVYSGDGTALSGVLADSGIQTPADLRGKRIPFIPGAASINEGMDLTLAFAGLTRADVKTVEFSSYTAATDGLLKGTADLAWLGPTAAKAHEIAASPHGLKWLEFPASDTAGWARLKKVSPIRAPSSITEGATLSKDRPAQGVNSPYTVWGLKGSNPEIAYFLAKTLDQAYDQFKGMHPMLPTWSLDRQAYWAKAEMPWPNHPGAIKYFKEKGIWTAEMEAWNLKMIQRQDTTVKAWNDLATEASAKGLDVKDIQKAWNLKIEEITGWKPS